MKFHASTSLLPKFKGEGYPNAHIKAYVIVIRKIIPWDAVVTKIFWKTLEAIALDWYYRISKASILLEKHHGSVGSKNARVNDVRCELFEDKTK